MSVILPAAANAPTARQRSLRRRSAGRSLEHAVGVAVDVMFRFKFRASRTEALWSETEHVWMGRQTFLYWALWDAEIDIPRMVANAIDAPEDADDLREAVRAALIVCWAHRTRSLPRRERPRWLPLP